MFLYTASGFEGKLDETAMKNCNEGTLAWIPKSEIMKLNLWEGDRIFMKLLLEDKGMFSMKLTYRGDELVDVVTEVY